MKTTRIFYDNAGRRVPPEQATWAEDTVMSKEGTVIERHRFYTPNYKPEKELLLTEKKA